VREYVAYSNVGIQSDLKSLCYGDPFKYESFWTDCDSTGVVRQEGIYTWNQSQPSACSACGGSWIAGGESSVFGEYDSGTYA